MDNAELTQVLILDDYRDPIRYATKTHLYANAMELLKKMGEPHSRFYAFRKIILDELETWEENLAWHIIANTVDVPHPYDSNYNTFNKYFNLLWERGEPV